MNKKVVLGLVISFMLCLNIIGCVAPEKLEGKQVMALLQEAVNGISKTVKPSVVYVEAIVSGRSYQMNALVLDEKGLLLLPFAIARSKRQNVTIERISVWIDQEEYQAELKESDTRLQISLIEIPVEENEGKNKPQLVPIKFGEPPEVQAGQWVVLVCNTGRNENYQKFVDLGMVAGEKYMGRTYEEIPLRLSTLKWAGMPVANLNGEIIGMMHYGNRVVAISEIKKGVDKLIAKSIESQKTPATASSKNKQPWLGFTYGPINEIYAEATELPKESIQVQYVFENSPADKMGLQPDDLIIEVDEQPIRETGQRALAQIRAFLDPEVGREITFKILREGKPLILKGTFKEKPEPKTFVAEDIGIKVQNITDIEYYGKGLSVKEGVLVTKVIPGSPAASSGISRIHVNNVIIELNKQPTPSIDEFIKVVNKIRQQKPPVVLVKLYKGTYISHCALNLRIGQEEKGDKK